MREVFEVVECVQGRLGILIIPNKPQETPAFSRLLRNCCELTNLTQDQGWIGANRSTEFDAIDVLDFFLEGMDFSLDEGDLRDLAYAVATELGWQTNSTGSISPPENYTALRMTCRLRSFTVAHTVLGRIFLSDNKPTGMTV